MPRPRRGMLNREFSVAELEEGDSLELPSRPDVVVKTDGSYTSTYKNQDELGKGKFGIVYKAQRKSDGEIYAAKFVHKSPAAKKEVLREIEMMNQLHHKRLIQLYDAYETKQDMIVVMELVTGGELFEKVVEEDNLTEKQVIRYMKQVLYGVQHMHRKCMVHLDLKPENILCLGGGKPGYEEIKLIDFGMTRILKAGHDETAMCGTPEFVAPEVITFNPITIASDMWSIGVITYVLLSGLSPFMGDNDSETLENVSSGEYDFEDDDEIFENLSDEVKIFIQDLLILDPKQRLTVDECLSHAWLRNEGSDKKINTANLKKFIARRRWQRTMNTIKAVSRLAGGLPLFGNKGTGAHGAGKGNFLSKVKAQQAREDEEENKNLEEERLKAEEEAKKQKEKEEVERKRKEHEAAEQKKKEEAEKKKLAAAKKKKEEELAAAAELKKKEELAAAQKKKKEEEEAAAAELKRKEELAAAAEQKKKEELAATKKKKEELAATKKKKEEEETAAAELKKREELAATKKKKEEELAAAAELKKKEELSATKKKKEEEEAAAKKKEEAVVKKPKEEPEVKPKVEGEKKVSEKKRRESVVKKKKEEEKAEKKRKEEEERKRKEQEKAEKKIAEKRRKEEEKAEKKRKEDEEKKNKKLSEDDRKKLREEERKKRQDERKSNDEGNNNSDVIAVSINGTTENGTDKKPRKIILTPGKQIQINGYTEKPTTSSKLGTSSPKGTIKKEEQSAQGGVANRAAAFQSGDAYWKNKK